MKTSFYKIYWGLLLMIINFSASNLTAQACYQGGQAGGYASAMVALGTSATSAYEFSPRPFDVTVFPNPLRKWEALWLRLWNVAPGTKVCVVVTDMLGNGLLTAEIPAGTQELQLLLPYDKMATGIYLITFQSVQSKLTRRILVTG